MGSLDTEIIEMTTQQYEYGYVFGGGCFISFPAAAPWDSSTDVRIHGPWALRLVQRLPGCLPACLVGENRV